MPSQHRATLALLVCLCTAGCRRGGQPPAPFSLPPASDAADFVKTAESLDNPRYQYLYLGLGGVGVLIGPDGTNSEIVETNAPELGIFPAEQWSGTSRVGGFHLSSQVSAQGTDDFVKTRGAPSSREITGFAQRLEIRRGVATTIYSERVGGRDVRCRVTSFVTPDGILVTRFDDNVGKRARRLYRHITFEGQGTLEEDGSAGSAMSMPVRIGRSRALLAYALSKDAAEGYWGSADARMYTRVFLAGAESTLTAFAVPRAGPDAGTPDEAEQRADAAREAGFGVLQQLTEAWWKRFWAASSVDVPDEALRRWYKRSLYYLAAMTAGADSPPGPMGPLRVRWGGRIFAHDLTYMHYALLTSNHIEEAAQI
ncbi:MAG: hypothetical protein ACE5JM_15290, partial [Armatimonadota bacterium]